MAVKAGAAAYIPLRHFGEEGEEGAAMAEGCLEMRAVLERMRSALEDDGVLKVAFLSLHGLPPYASAMRSLVPFPPSFHCLHPPQAVPAPLHSITPSFQSPPLSFSSLSLQSLPPSFLSLLPVRPSCSLLPVSLSATPSLQYRRHTRCCPTRTLKTWTPSLRP